MGGPVPVQLEATEALPAARVAIRRPHLLEKESISKLSDELGLQPTVFYRRQREFFENAASAFEQKARRAGANRLS